ncbi:MAG: DUF3570 domain-containing protein [Myxococcales bacterium]|nr:DUF3570 domain-containing protein [Myxococcales bacterium]
MRLRLNASRTRSLKLCLALAVLSALALPIVALIGAVSSLRADDRVTIRGNYYREPSTRVLAPVVTVEVDAPDERLTVEGQYLLDVVTSASIASGAAAVTGGDALFTEMRHEGTLRLRSKIKEWAFGGEFRYSTESDYISRQFGANVTRAFLNRSVRLGLVYKGVFSSVMVIRPSFRDTVPWISPSDPNGPEGTNLLQTHYIKLAYGHDLHRTVTVGVQLEGVFSRGPHENPYRRVNGSEFQAFPFTLNRFAPNLYFRWALPKVNWIALEGRYRFYFDDWKVRSHTFDTRLHFRLARHLLIRLRYQYYTQTAAFFALPAAEQPYPMDAIYKTSAPQLQAHFHHTPGIMVMFELEPLARVRGLGWLSGAWIQATYNHILTLPRSGNCLDYTFPYSLCRVNEAGQIESEYAGARNGSLALSIPF